METESSTNFGGMCSSKRNWTFEQIQDLINAVRNHPCLYDRRDPTYNQSRFKEDAWKKICRSINGKDKPAEDCKKKWKTLRIQQRRLLIKKFRKKGKFQGSQWNCYESLKFLIPHMDWTVAEENFIKKEAEGDIDIEDDNLNESISNEDSKDSKSEDPLTASPFGDFQPECSSRTGVEGMDSRNLTDKLVFNNPSFQQVIQPVVSNPSMPAKSQSLSQFVLTYVPTTTPPSHVPNNEDHLESIPTVNNSANNPARSSKNFTDSSSSMTGSTPQILQTPISSHCLAANQTVPISSCHVITPNSHIGQRTTCKEERGLPVEDAANGGVLNYFLLDVSQQMNKLNDIAQMEVKIDIHKLLLEKLKNLQNLRRT